MPYPVGPGPVASNSRDAGTDHFYFALLEKIHNRLEKDFDITSLQKSAAYSKTINVIPENRVRYLSEIGEVVSKYNEDAAMQADIADRLYGLKQSIELLHPEKDLQVIKQLQKIYKAEEQKLSPGWDD